MPLTGTSSRLLSIFIRAPWSVLGEIALDRARIDRVHDVRPVRDPLLGEEEVRQVAHVRRHAGLPLRLRRTERGAVSLQLGAERRNLDALVDAQRVLRVDTERLA